MKPNFALDFRNDAITLLHRTTRGWQVVGEARLDDADLAGALSYLRTTALELSPQSVTTKLVIPNSQILYTQVPVTAQDGTRRRKQVARALEGVTPYAVADLAFDISGSGPLVDVAVIAKETLAEAEAFATEHRFNPVCFVAVPEAGGFGAEPWFGQTSCAAAHLADGQRVERDSSPIVIIGHEPPAQDPVADEVLADGPTGGLAGGLAGGPVGGPAAATTPVDPAPPVAEPDALPARPEAEMQPGQAPSLDPVLDRASPVETAVDETKAVETAVETATNEAAAAAPAPPAEASAAVAPVQPPGTAPTLTATPTAVQSAVQSAVDPEPEAILDRVFAQEAQQAHTPTVSVPPSETAAQVAQQPGPDAGPETPFAPEPATAPTSGSAADASPAMVDEAPMALDVVDDLAEDRPPLDPPKVTVGVLNPSIPDDLPPPPAASVMVAFGSRRALEASAKEAAAKGGAGRAGAPARPSPTGKAPTLGTSGPSRSGPQAKVTTLPPRPTPPSVVRLPPRPGAPSGMLPPDPAAAVARPVIKPAAKPVAKTSTAGKALRGLGALVTSPVIAGAKERRPAPQMVTPPTGPSTAASAAAATLTKPAAKPYSGGLGNRSLERPRPRYLGLILTGILLVFLALVAAWSTLFLETRDTTTPDPNAVVDAAPVAQDVPAIEDEMLADLQVPPGSQPEAQPEAPPATAAPDPEAEAIADAVASAAPIPPAPTPSPEPAPIVPPDTATATAAPLLANPQDEFLLATMDAPPAIPDALSLPQPLARNDAPPGPAAPPPPFGTVYQFDAAGLIVPTPEGIMTPEGVVLFAGRPTPEPPPRPASLAPATPSVEPVVEPAAVAEPDPASGTTADVFPSDPALAGARPRARPAALTPPTQNADDDASLAPADGSRFASLRPRAKPSELAAAAMAARPAADPAADQIAALGAQAASLTAQANVTAAVASGAQSPLILAVSRKPAPRPSDMSAAVEAAVAVASRPPTPQPQPQVEEPAEEPAAKTEAEADDEPEVTTAMPRLPTKTTVAKQATYVNAINLSKVNLIGIYGSSSDRYALIRHANGRYKKVKVGDSFDGGKVAAITTSEVRYQKSGKMVTLALPKG